ncbi:unnamed protein product [Didymodactylos carnosus]|uniref:Plant heme peroxidase family profile domain-containing protein n=1 Tax=Didymodactylos carnosus TaxID=1234261 RepID=A0A8S2SY46_9BILA|nr:unnamed protein product [Didymodactylos carnosus]CAF4250835.1 unnamed protein product [Didymodactylos carnosus]
MGCSPSDLDKHVLSNAAKTSIDYIAVAKHVSKLIPDQSTKDGYGPPFVRLAWHSCATYSEIDNSGGSNGAYMRLEFPETDPLHGGLDLARKRLEPIKQAFPFISYADLYVLCGVVAISEMGGPKVPFRPGRVDIKFNNLLIVEQKERFPIPDDSMEKMHEKFRRMGFGKKEMVALLGAHCLGRCYKDRSDFDGPWVDHPTKFTNEFFEELIENEWKASIVPETGKEQFEAYPEGEKLLMLPTDMYLLKDPETNELVEIYAKDQQKSFNDFVKAFGRLLEFGAKTVSYFWFAYTMTGCF